MLRRTLALTAFLLALTTANAGATERVWQQTGPLTEVRNHGPALAALPDGRALLAGGGPSTAEIYDPRANAWTAVAPMAHARWEATAVTLRDGRVLVIGGADYRVPAEVYDPATNRWTETGGIAAGHQREARAVLLADGRVLSLQSGRDIAAIYDPATNAWTATTTLRRSRMVPVVVALRNGQVLIAGDGSAETYDPATDTSERTLAPVEYRRAAGGTLLPDGRVLVAGGDDHGATSQTSEIYDPATRTWSAAGRLAAPHGEGNTLLTLADGTPLLIGGAFWENGCRYLDRRSEIYDVMTGKWTPTVPLVDYHLAQGAVALPDGSALVAGNAASGPLAERFVPLETVIGGPLIIPPAPSPTPAPPVSSMPKPVGVAAFARPLPRKLKTKGGTVTVKVRCSGGECRDKVVLKRWNTTLASGSFVAGDGQTATVKLKLKRRLKNRTTSVTLELARQQTTLFASLRR